MNDSNRSSRLPRTHRAPLQYLPEMRLTARDREIVLLSYDYRAMTADLVERVLFPARQREQATVSSRCLHRLKLLYHHGYLARYALAQVLGQRGAFVYTLDQRGAALVAEMLSVAVENLDWKVQDNQMVRGPFIDHLLMANTVRAALEVDAQRHGVAVANWQDDKALRRMPLLATVSGPHGARQVELVPDGTFYLIQGNQAMAYCLELDAGTETVRSHTGIGDWVSKVRAYLAVAGTRNLRVLTVVTKGERRLTNLMEAAEQLGARAIFHFARYEAVTTPTSAPWIDRIWRRAGAPGQMALLS